jgi:ssDNA-binding Zn-finger/Zn-ribbon topoisomerase 1
MKKEPTEKTARIKLILNNICPECKSELILSDSKKSSTCVKCRKSYDLEIIKLNGYRNL